MLALFAIGALVPNLDTNDIEQIMVTATRQPQSVETIASGVSVLTADDLKARQIVRIVDALKSLPGVSVANGGGAGGTTQLRLRGAEANQILVLIDGVKASDPAAGDEFQFEHLTVTEIERIELVRGPLSSAWGSDAVAGVINIVTKKGEGEPTVTVRGEGGSFGTYRVGGSFKAGAKDWHLSAGLDYSNTDGVNVSREGREDDGYENLTANIRAGINPSDRLSFDVSARFEDGRSEFDSIDFISTGLPADSDNVTNTKKYYLSAGAKFDIIPGKVSQSARVTYLDTEIANRANGNFDGRTGAQKWGFYGDLALTPIENHTLTLILDHEDTDFIQRGLVLPFGDPNQNQNMTVTGYGASYVGRFADFLSLTGAVRRDDNSDFRNVTTWRVGASADIAATGSRIFASVGRGQKAPTFVERYGFFSSQFAGNPSLRPEKTKQWEFGIEQKFERVTLTATAFFTDLTNEINGFAFDPVTFLFTAENIDGESKRDGFELSLDAEITDQISFTSQYSFVNSREGLGQDTERHEVRRPRHQAFAGLAYRPSNAFSLALDVDYTGKATDDFFAPGAFSATTVQLDSYWLVRLAAEYQLTEQIVALARFENLLDEDYEDIFGFNTPGLGAFAGLRVKF